MINKRKYTLDSSYTLGDPAILSGVGTIRKNDPEKNQLYVARKLINFSEFFLRSKNSRNAVTWRLGKAEIAKLYSR